MKYFAILDENNIVINAQTVDDTIVYEEDEVSLETIISNDPRSIEYSLDTSITNNPASIGYRYDSNLNAFIPPCSDDTYILNTQTFEWEPDPELEYDLHGNGIMYRYSSELKGWTLIQTEV